MDSGIEETEGVDLVGVGLGPFNAGLAALLSETCPEVKSRFFEQKDRFLWHPGMQIHGAVVQVPFLADFVSLVHPTSRFSYLNYLHQYDRLLKFYFREDMHVPRIEFQDYGQWVLGQIESCSWNHKVTRIAVQTSSSTGKCFRVEYRNSEGEHHCDADSIVLGTGTRPVLPKTWKMENVSNGGQLLHSSQYLTCAERLENARKIVVVGSGQSAGEIVLDLLRRRTPGGPPIQWLTRSPGFFPMEYSKLGLEHFSASYIDLFWSLSTSDKNEVLRRQDLLYKGMSEKTIAEIYEELYLCSIGGAKPPLELFPQCEVRSLDKGDGQVAVHTEHRLTGERAQVLSDYVIACTGYAHDFPECAIEILETTKKDEFGRPRILRNYALDSDEFPGRVFVQNLEIHSHGIGAPDLGLGAYRNAEIIHQLVGRKVFKCHDAAVFTRFGQCPGGQASKR